MKPTDQTKPNEQTVRELAYQLWEQRGRPEGGAEQDWLAAENRLRHEYAGTQSASGTTPIQEPRGAVGDASSSPLAEGAAARPARSRKRQTKSPAPSREEGEISRH